MPVARGRRVPAELPRAAGPAARPPAARRLHPVQALRRDGRRAAGVVAAPGEAAALVEEPGAASPCRPRTARRLPPRSARLRDDPGRAAASAPPAGAPPREHARSRQVERLEEVLLARRAAAGRGGADVRHRRRLRPATARPSTGATVERDARRDAPPRPRRRGRCGAASGRRRARAPAPGDRRPQPGRPRSRWATRTARCRSPSTARSTTTRRCARSSSAAATASARAATPRCSSTSTRSTARAMVEHLDRHVRLRDLGRAAASGSFVARDRLGIKPLYWFDDGRRFAFASEIKALLPLLPRREVDPVALAHYLTFVAVPPPRTLFDGVQQARPGDDAGRRPRRARHEPRALLGPAREPRAARRRRRRLGGGAALPARALDRAAHDERRARRRLPLRRGRLVDQRRADEPARRPARSTRSRSASTDADEFNEFDWARRVAEQLRHRPPRGDDRRRTTCGASCPTSSTTRTSRSPTRSACRSTSCPSWPRPTA